MSSLSCLDESCIIDGRNWKISLFRYCERLQDSTPNQCQWGTIVEAFVFSIIKNINLAIYVLNNSTDKHYTKRAEKIVCQSPLAVCLWHDGNHFLSLFPNRKQDKEDFIDNDRVDRESNSLKRRRVMDARNTSFKRQRFSSPSPSSIVRRMTENDLKELYDTVGAKLKQQN
eukprot:scaffold70397_cov22-Cyclotella_meneghiniana.AAC.1